MALQSEDVLLQWVVHEMNFQAYVDNKPSCFKNNGNVFYQLSIKEKSHTHISNPRSYGHCHLGIRIKLKKKKVS